MAIDFNKALDTKVKDVEPPKQLPQGTYIVAVSKPPQQARVNDDWEKIVFPVKVISATDTVDPKELKEFGDLSTATVRGIEFMFPTNGDVSKPLFYMTRFLEDHLQVDTSDNPSVKELLARSVNHQCLATVEWRPNPKDPEQVFVEIRRTAPLE